MEPQFILITGCSSGGKSTLLDALEGRGYAGVPEPGRRIVDEERTGDGNALPWIDLEKFAYRAVDVARADLERVSAVEGVVFFDRGLVDAAVALEFAGGPSYRETLGSQRHYAKTVFVAPPWPEIYEADAGRRHGFEDAKAEHDRLAAALLDLGYDAIALPKTSVQERTDFVLQELGLD